MRGFAKRLKARLAASAGETLVETLAAIMVSALAITALTTAVATAADFNRQANEAAGKARYEQNFASMHWGYGDWKSDLDNTSVGSVTVRQLPGSGEPPVTDEETLPVDVFGGDDIVSYELKDAG